MTGVEPVSALWCPFHKPSVIGTTPTTAPLCSGPSRPKRFETLCGTRLRLRPQLATPALNLVEEAGFEPAISSFRKKRERPAFPTPRLKTLSLLPCAFCCFDGATEGDDYATTHAHCVLHRFLHRCRSSRLYRSRCLHRDPILLQVWVFVKHFLKLYTPTRTAGPIEEPPKVTTITVSFIISPS